SPAVATIPVALAIPVVSAIRGASCANGGALVSAVQDVERAHEGERRTPHCLRQDRMSAMEPAPSGGPPASEQHADQRRCPRCHSTKPVRSSTAPSWRRGPGGEPNRNDSGPTAPERP